MTRAHAVMPGPAEFADSNKWEDCKRILRNPDVVLDCGAHIGQTAVNLREAYPHATVYCFEPATEPFTQLQARATSLRIHPAQVAVGNFNGNARLHLTACSQSNSLLDYLEHDNPYEKPHRVVGEETVRVCRLDDWCRENDLDPERIDLLKMDVQGAEVDALRGAVGILQTVRIVLLEVAFVSYYEECPLIDDVERFLHTHRFKRHALYRSADPEIWADAIYVPDH